MALSAKSKLDAKFPGINDGALKALELLKITTVGGLATSLVFANAVTLVSAANGTGSNELISTTTFSKLVKQAKTEKKLLLHQVPDQPISALRAIPQSSAKDIADKLGVGSIRALSSYIPYRVAKEILQVLRPRKIAGPKEPAYLVPASGEHVMETAEYTTFLHVDVNAGKGAEFIDVNSNKFSPIDLDALAKSNAGLQTVAYGALLTFSQSWFTKGVTLGQLIHSITLAPGEITRIAIVDWSRKTDGTLTDKEKETDALKDAAAHKRVINEVTNAMAKEAQSGFSNNASFGLSSQSGKSSTSETGFLGISLASSHSEANGTSFFASDGSSGSKGNRTVGATMLQNGLDRTHQIAHDLRNRRSSVIREVSQAEHEKVSTRIIANYNHMHALTMQYYEAVQIYRVKMTLKSVDKVIFLPIKSPLTPADSHTPSNNGLLEVSLNDDVSYSPYTEIFLVLSEVVKSFGDLAQPEESLQNAAREKIKKWNDQLGPSEKADIAGVKDIAAAYRALRNQLWGKDQLEKLKGIMEMPTLRSDTTSLFLPPTTRVLDARVEPPQSATVIVDLPGRQIYPPFTKVQLELSTIQDIILHLSPESPSSNQSLVLTCSLNGHKFDLKFPAISMLANSDVVVTTIFKPLELSKIPSSPKPSESSQVGPATVSHEHAAVRPLDDAQILSLLSSYGMSIGAEKVPLINLVDPTPVGYVGNYVAFKTNYIPGQKEMADLLKEKGFVLGTARETIVPLGSGGVFAEGVLGRSNCAEKLDITRFWNWKDSPPLFTPPEIAPVKVDSRRGDVNLKPAEFSKPMINISQPTSLPDPLGISGALTALQTANMFRDMSGMEAMSALGQTMIKATHEGASNAAEQAMQTMKDLLEANTERYKATTDLVKSLVDTAAGVYKAQGNISERGAELNEASEMSEAGGADDAEGETQDDSKEETAGENGEDE